MSLKHDVIKQLVESYNRNSFACLGELLADYAVYDDGERWLGKKQICRHFQSLITSQWIQNYGITAQAGFLQDGEEVVLHMDNDWIHASKYLRVFINEKGLIVRMELNQKQDADHLVRSDESLLDRKGIYLRSLYPVFKRCFEDQKKELKCFDADPGAFASIMMILDGQLTYINVTASVGQLLGQKRDKMFVEGFRRKCQEDHAEGIMIRACIGIDDGSIAAVTLPVKNGAYQIENYEIYGKNPDETEREKLIFDDSYKIAQIDEFPMMMEIAKEFRESFLSLDFEDIFKRFAQEISCYDFSHYKEYFGKGEVTSFFNELVDQSLEINKIVDSHLMILRFNGHSEKMAKDYSEPYLPYFSGEPTVHVSSPLYENFLMIRFSLNPLGQIDTIYLVRAFVYVRSDGEEPKEMSRFDLHQYGIKVMVQDFLNRGYDVTMMRFYPEPHIQVYKDDKYYDMIVRTSRFPYHPRFTQEEFKELEDFCRERETIALFAEVSCWGSDDRKWDVRMDESLHCEFDVLIIDPESEETDRKRA